MRERKGGKVRNQLNVEQMLHKALNESGGQQLQNGGGKPVCGVVSCKTTMKQTGGNWSHSLRSRQVRWDDPSQYHQEIESVLVGGRLSSLLPPPACGKLLNTECDTHTHTHSAALWRSRGGPK